MPGHTRHDGWWRPSGRTILGRKHRAHLWRQTGIGTWASWCGGWEGPSGFLVFAGSRERLCRECRRVNLP